MSALGKYKVAWMNGANTYSVMLDTTVQKDAFIRDNHLRQYVAFELISMSDGFYHWVMLNESAGRWLKWLDKWWWLLLLVFLYLAWHRFFGRRVLLF